jgi:hypothetical protein
MKEYKDYEQLKKDAQASYDGAVNLTALAGTLHAMCLYLSHQGKGTQEIYDDPCVRLVLDQMHFLCFRVNASNPCSHEDYKAVYDD